jgi:hypothetical protein
MSFIKKIQQKSHSTRLLALWVSVGLVMFVIIAIWLFSFSHNINPQKAKEGIGKTEFPSLFESIKKDFGSIKQMFQANLKNINLEENEGQ